MAIELEVIELGGFATSGNAYLPCMRAPLEKRTRIAAAGAINLQEGTKLVLLRNHADALHVRFGEPGDTTQAATSDTQSFKLYATKDEVPVKLSSELVGGVLDIRAA